MKGNKAKLFGVVMALVLAVALASVGVVQYASADPGSPLKWSEVTIPEDGATGDYALWNGSDVGPIAVSPDGDMIFAASGSASGNFTYLMRSTDGGYTWKQVMTTYDGTSAAFFPDNIVDIVVSPDWADDDTVVVATTAEVYISVDKGVTFADWGASGVFTGNITSLDVALDENGNLVAVIGTSSGSHTGDIYLRTMTKTWEDQDVEVAATTGWDVLDVGMPTYATDEGIVAVVSDGTDTYAVTKLGTNDWGANIADTTFVDQNGDGFDSSRASLGFPDDYNLTVTAYGGNNVYFVGLTGEDVDGDVFKLTSMPVGATNVLAEDLNLRGLVGVNPTETDIFSIAVTGDLAEATIIAGTAKYDTGMTPAQRLVYYSTDAGTTWDYTLKSPTGGPTGANTYVVIGSPIAYVGTSGTESAFSASTTDPVGNAWNQRGLIDTVITTISDIAASDTYLTDKQLFMATNNGSTSFSLWLTSDEGLHWDRILCNSPAGVPFNSVQLVPGYVFVAMKGMTYILRSHDGGTTFLSLLFAKTAITAWKVTGPTTVYTGHALGAVWWTTDFATWADPDESDITGTVTSIVVGPAGAILVGDSNGKVYICYDESIAFEFERVGPGAVETGNPNMYVAFDADYYTNDTIYTGSAGSAIYRFVIDDSTVWDQISPATPTIDVSGLVVMDDGTLYASGATANASVHRSVNPTKLIAEGGPDFEQVDVTGLVAIAPNATLGLLRVVPGSNSNTLFAVKTAPDPDQLLTFTDTLTGKVTLATPTDGTTSGDILENKGLARVVISWQGKTGAMSYEYQVALDEAMLTVIAGASSYTAGQVKDVELWLGTTYYWRVRVGAAGSTVGSPLLSQWSETWSFNTPLGPGAARPILESPEAGQEGVELRPVLEWSGLIDATNYELMVAEDCDWNDLVVDKTGAAALGTETVYAITTDLEYLTDYCWKAKALTLDAEGTVVTESPWSDIGTFTTIAEPTAAEAAPTPAWVWVVIAISAILLVAVIVLIVRTRRAV